MARSPRLSISAVLLLIALIIVFGLVYFRNSTLNSKEYWMKVVAAIEGDIRLGEMLLTNEKLEVQKKIKTRDIDIAQGTNFYQGPGSSLEKAREMAVKGYLAELEELQVSANQMEEKLQKLQDALREARIELSKFP